VKTIALGEWTSKVKLWKKSGSYNVEESFNISDGLHICHGMDYHGELWYKPSQ